jgi:soluble lytic murein transglycosylase-like protein
MRGLPLVSLACSVFAAASAAHADIYTYTDEAGTPHYSNVPADYRYVLLLKSPPEESPAAASAPRIGAGWRARAAGYGPLIDRVAASTALQPALIRAVIAVESAFNPRAVSRAGAQGLMQLQPATARRYGVGNAFDPEQNVSGGARYLSDLLKRYKNNLELALAAYNAGEDAVDRHGVQIPPYRETREYVPAVLRLYRELLTQRT